MEITAIEPRRKGLSQLYIDGEAAVKLDTQIVLQNRLKPGVELTDEMLYELIQRSDARRAQEKALYLLEYRGHSRKELEDKIARTAASREAAAAAALHMEEIGLVDDRKYALTLAESLFLYKRYGRRRVVMELQRKGISGELLEEVLDTYAEVDFIGNARAILMRKYRDYEQDERIRKRAFAGLQRLGYSYDEIRAAMAIRDELYPEDIE